MSNKPRIWELFCMLLLIIAVANTSYGAKSSNKAIPEKKIHMFMIAMDSGIIEKRALSDLKRLTRSKDETIKARAIGLLAQYEGEGSGNLIKALTILSPYLLEKKDADSFKRKLIGGKDDKEFLNAIPPASKWKFQEPELCVSMARILAFGGKYSEALAAFDRVGKNKEGVPRIMAAEGIGDMQFALKRWEQCIGSYQFALKSIGYLKKLYKYDETTPDPIINALSKRIQRKLNEAKRKWDEERYGPGFVAYREARQKQFGKNYLSAVIAYKRITENFPDTVYSEAAGLYGPQCLFKLALPGKNEKMEKTLDNLKDKIFDNKKKLRKYGKLMTIPVRERLEKRIANEEKYLAELKQVPTGKKAEEKAIADLESFIKENESGLYRGEAYLELARHTMEELLDPDKTEAFLNESQKWFDNIKKLNKALSGYNVPSKAKSVSAPPSNLFTKDNSQNIKTVTFSPGMVININTCPWYLDFLRTKFYQMKGFIAFSTNKKEDAKKYFSLMKRYDKLNQVFEKQGDWGNYKRLMKGVEIGFLYANKSELKNYSEKNRFLILLGDFYYITMRFDKAAEIHKRILAGCYGTPSKLMTSYAHYMLGTYYYWKNKRISAFEEWKQSIALGSSSYTGERAMFAAGQMATDYMGPGVKKEQRASYKKEGNELLMHLARKGKNRDLVNQAKLNIAMSERAKGDIEKAEKIIKSIKPKNDKEKKVIKAYLKIISISQKNK